MAHSIALVIRATSALGHTAARLLAAKGNRQVNAGPVPYKKRVLTAAGVEAAQAPLNQPPSTDCRVAPFRNQLTT